MARKQTTPALGAAFGGGFYGGEIVVDGDRCALVVAPKTEDEKLGLEYKKQKLNTFDGTDSEDDGFYNSALMDDTNHPAAQFCRSLLIGGFDDWYLPSRDELMRIWMSLGPNRKKTPELFKSGGAEAFEERWHWSSTESASYSGHAWIVSFTNGYQNSTSKGTYFGVRAVRRLKI
jgi:hypothetical protein